MLMRFQRIAAIIALTACLVVPFGIAIWKASSYSPQPPSQRAAAKNENKTAADTLEERHQAAEEAIATYTLWLMAFTGILAVATAGLGALNFFQVRLARSEFLSTHRPHIRLKAIWLASADGQTFNPELRVNEPLVVRLDIVNFGNTTAFITRLNLASVLVPRNGQLPQRPPYNEPAAPGLDFYPPVQLNRGVTFTQGISDGHKLDALELSEIYNGDRILYFVGTIDYRDSIGNPMQTAFCRCLRFLRFNAGPVDRGRFETDKNPHYEYQD
jgi:hypothetical protein